MGKSIRFISGAMMGGMVGAVLVLLMTPTSGEKFRRQIIENIERVRNELENAATNRRDELEGELAKLRSG